MGILWKPPDSGGGPSAILLSGGWGAAPELRPSGLTLPGGAAGGPAAPPLSPGDRAGGVGGPSGDRGGGGPAGHAEECRRQPHADSGAHGTALVGDSPPPAPRADRTGVRARRATAEGRAPAGAAARQTQGPSSLNGNSA